MYVFVYSYFFFLSSYFQLQTLPARPIPTQMCGVCVCVFRMNRTAITNPELINTDFAGNNRGTLATLARLAHFKSQVYPTQPNISTT